MTDFQAPSLRNEMLMSIEVGKKTWVLAFTNGKRHRRKSVAAWTTKDFIAEVKRAKRK